MSKERVFEKLKEIEENIEIIKNNLPSSLEEFKRMGLVKDGIYKRLEHSIENVIDISAMISQKSTHFRIHFAPPRVCFTL